MRRVREFDRFYDMGEYLCETNGFGAVLRPMPAARRAGIKPPNDKTRGAFEEFRSRSVAPASARSLLSVLAWPACDRCEGARDIPCVDCRGEGLRRVTCGSCDHAHDHPCEACDQGRLACPDCNKMAPIVVGGEWFDVRLVRQVVTAMGVGSEDLLGYAVRRDERGSVELVLRSGDVLGVVMGARFDPEKEVPRWP